MEPLHNMTERRPVPHAVLCSGAVSHGSCGMQHLVCTECCATNGAWQALQARPLPSTVQLKAASPKHRPSLFVRPRSLRTGSARRPDALGMRNRPQMRPRWRPLLEAQSLRMRATLRRAWHVLATWVMAEGSLSRLTSSCDAMSRRLPRLCGTGCVRIRFSNSRQLAERWELRAGCPGRGACNLGGACVCDDGNRACYTRTARTATPVPHGHASPESNWRTLGAV